MQYIIVFLYLYCLYLSAKKRMVQLFACILLFSLFMSEIIFNDNITLYIKAQGTFCSLFFLFTVFFIFLYLLFVSYGLFGVFVHTLVVTLIPFFGILTPLNPIILLYRERIFPLPSLDISILNLFILNLIPAIFFSFKTPGFIRGLILSLTVLSLDNTIYSTSQKKLNVVVVQVGLYLESVGFRDNLSADLIEFIKDKNVDLIVFSENTFLVSKIVI